MARKQRNQKNNRSSGAQLKKSRKRSKSILDKRRNRMRAFVKWTSHWPLGFINASKKVRKLTKKSSQNQPPPVLESMTQNPGLQHIVEIVFHFLDKTSLLNCRLVNTSWQKIVDQPRFCLKYLKYYSWLYHDYDPEVDDEVEDDQRAKCYSNVGQIYSKEDVLASWGSLANQLGDDDLHVKKEFQLVLLKMCPSYDSLRYYLRYYGNWYEEEDNYDDKEIDEQDNPSRDINQMMHPLAMLRTLQYACITNIPEECMAQHRPESDVLISFILEHVDASSKIDTYVEGYFYEFPDNAWTYIEDLTPLHLAVLDGRTASVKKMVEKYNPLSTMERNEKGIFCGTLTPMHLAALKGHTDMIKILAPLIPDDPNLPFNGDEVTPIICAARRGHLNFIKTLASLSANPMIPDVLGRNPIHCAAAFGHLEIVKFLVGLTDDPNIRSEGIFRSYTPIEMAKSNGHKQVVQFLKEYIVKKQRAIRHSMHRYNLRSLGPKCNPNSI